MRDEMTEKSPLDFKKTSLITYYHHVAMIVDIGSEFQDGLNKVYGFLFYQKLFTIWSRPWQPLIINLCTVWIQAGLTTDLPQVTDKHYHIMLYRVHLSLLGPFSNTHCRRVFEKGPNKEMLKYFFINLPDSTLYINW